MDDSRGFEQVFGRTPAVRSSAPGRVNLMGEHTDYNGGYVLPTAIPRRTRVELARREDRLVRASSADVDGGLVQVYQLGSETAGRGWLDYIQGVTHALREAAHRVEGFDLRVRSSIPIGSGLSSSAALEVALLRGLRDLFALPLDDVQLARIGQRAENDFVGARVGIMDQMACSLADEGAALFLDTRGLHFEQVPLPPGADLVVISSGIAHAHAGGEYNTRRAECEAAARLLGVPGLRDVELNDLPRVATLPAPLDRRVRHVVTENARVVECVAALRAGDLPRAGALFATSHASMRDDFEVSLPEIDLLVSLAARNEDVYGARLTGGGFGGAIVLLAHAGRGRLAAEATARQYAEQSGHIPSILVPQRQD